MKSYRSVLATAATLSLLTFGCAGVAAATPDISPSGSCSWTLIPPQVVSVSDTHMVLAKVKPGSCTMNAEVNMTVVCISVQGGDSGGQCGNKPTPDTAFVYYPYRAGATYVVTGQGCADLFENPIDHSTTGPTSKVCQSLGPSSFTL